MLPVDAMMTSLTIFCLCFTLISSQSLSQFFWNMISHPQLDPYIKNFLKTSVAQEMFDIEMPPQTTPPPEGQFGKPGDINIFGLPPPSSEMMFGSPQTNQPPPPQQRNDIRPRQSDIMATWSESLQQSVNNVVGQQQQEQQASSNQGNRQNYDTYNTGNSPSVRDNFESSQGRFGMAGSSPNIMSSWQQAVNTETFPMRPGQGISPQTNNFFMSPTNQASPPLSLGNSQMMDNVSSQEKTSKYYYSSANSPLNNYNQNDLSSNYPGESNNYQMQNNIPGNSFPGNQMQNNIPGNSFPGNQMQNNIPGNSFPVNQMQNNVPGNSFPGNQVQNNIPGNSFPGNQMNNNIPPNSFPNNAPSYQELQHRNLPLQNYENVPQNTAGQRNVRMNSESYAPPASYHRNTFSPEHFLTTPSPSTSTPPPPNVMPDNGKMVSNSFRHPTGNNNLGASSYQRNYQPHVMTSPGRNTPGVNVQENGPLLMSAAANNPPRMNPPNYYTGPNNNWSSSNVPWISQQRDSSAATLLQYNSPSPAPRYPNNNKFNSETINNLPGPYQTPTPPPISPFPAVPIPPGMGSQYRLSPFNIISSNSKFPNDLLFYRPPTSQTQSIAPFRFNFRTPTPAPPMASFAAMRQQLPKSFLDPSQVILSRYVPSPHVMDKMMAMVGFEGPEVI